MALSPVLVTGRKQGFAYAAYVLTVVLGGAAEKNLVLIVECVGKAGSKTRLFLLSFQPGRRKVLEGVFQLGMFAGDELKQRLKTRPGRHVGGDEVAGLDRHLMRHV